ncbi:MAG: hypothetical protein ABI591_17450 [Kofleriaceae bacterium]
MSQLRTITTINPVIGDESFVAAFGRLPTPFDDPATRVATHVGYVARTLRERGGSQPQRLRVLDALDQYVAAGAFPDSETDHDLLPTFLDPHTGVRCAVAHLVETTAGTAMMVELDRDHHNDYVADLADDPRFVAWTAGSGLTAEELAMIQPGYPPPPPTDVLYAIAAEGDLAIHDDSPTTAARSTTTTAPLHDFAMLDASLRVVSQHLNHFVGKPSLELDGKIGITNGEHTAYDAGVKLGGEVRVHRQTFAYSAGLGVDSYGPATPRAWTIPIEGAYRIEHDELAFGVHGGPRFTVAGDRTFGWNVGLEVRRRDLFCDVGRYDPRDLMVSVDATRIGDAVFVGLTVGVGNPRGRYWYED